ncbi:heavy metal translocating P-type ATPase [Ereboglobus luteus]|uniref:Heavy metal translocating P-type ATPase n=1 Tax=Ereboglobus luteus TaxID=1796921 RepID=A0A2U8E0B3_9BACT|nr:cation-translocating P-type ATPase [Ereboglobus luteus]AWI08022.1 heavy metal translocating P-type ATPase [Ereboglobus luteus]
MTTSREQDHHDENHHHDDDDHEHGHDHGHGHQSGHGHHHHGGEWKNLALLAGLCGVLGVAGFVIERAEVGPAWLAGAFYIAALVAGAWDAAKDSWENIKARTLDIHFLMLAVAVGAACIGAWHEAVVLLFLFSGAEAMEAYAMDRTQREVSSLLKSAPKTATLLDAAGMETTVEVAALAVGNHVRVKPGEAFPTDGTVIKGESACDESTITGEATPVEKEAGAAVYSGTINLWGVLDFEVNRLPSESTLQKIIRMIQTAQKLRAPSERFTDKFGGHYTLLALGACAVMFFVWWLGFGAPPFISGETTSAFYRAMTLLVVMSPCALVLSIPSAILAAIAWGARHGVLFRGGAAIEKLADVDVIALDKTGTLTTGKLSVATVESFPPGRESDVLRLACALENNSQHPLARAIVKHAQNTGVQTAAVEAFESLTGMGLRGRVDGVPVLLGRRELIIENHTGPLVETIKSFPLSSPDLSEVWVTGGDVTGRILLRDEIRTTSRDTLAKLRANGVRTVMLTGDRRHAAENIARELGLDEVRSGLKPEDKVEAIQSFREQGKRIAMVGDGVNDAPSLAAADVSIAMGARGSDAALEQAEVILMHDRIENVLAAFRLSRRAKRIIRQNLAVSLGVVVIMATGSIIGLVPLWLGVIAHEGSSVVVCLNALRLLLGKNK